MSLETKTLTEFVRATTGKFNKVLPEVDPTIQSSAARGFVVSSAAEGVGLQTGFADLINQAFEQTANGDFLTLHCNADGVYQFDAQQSSGYCDATGTLGTTIEADDTLTANGNSYTVLSDADVASYSDSITLSCSGSIVTAVTDSEHSLATGLDVTISDATDDNYNGTFEVTVIDENTFTYELEDASGLDSDTGTYTSEYAHLNVQSVDSGADQDIESGGKLTISLDDIDSTVYACTDGITGGEDEEGEEDFRDRGLEARRATPGIAVGASIKKSAKSISGNTRVFIVRPVAGVTGGTAGEAGYYPHVGETVVYVLRDNDDSITPTTTILDETKEQIISDGNWPNFLNEDSLYVLAPTLLEVDFTFSSITPDTTTMQNSIESQLTSFFQDNAQIEGTIKLSTIKSFLDTVTDSSTGETLSDYTLTAPTDDIEADSGEIATLGDVTFS